MEQAREKGFATARWLLRLLFSIGAYFVRLAAMDVFVMMWRQAIQQHEKRLRASTGCGGGMVVVVVVVVEVVEVVVVVVPLVGFIRDSLVG